MEILLRVTIPPLATPPWGRSWPTQPLNLARVQRGLLARGKRHLKLDKWHARCLQCANCRWLWGLAGQLENLGCRWGHLQRHFEGDWFRPRKFGFARNWKFQSYGTFQNRKCCHKCLCAGRGYLNMHNYLVLITNPWITIYILDLKEILLQIPCRNLVGIHSLIRSRTIRGAHSRSRWPQMRGNRWPIRSRRGAGAPKVMRSWGRRAMRLRKQ